MAVYLSHKIDSNTPLYGGAAGISIGWEKEIASGQASNVSVWRFPAHSGTHLDAPKHFYDCSLTVDSYPPEYWFCRKVETVIIPMLSGRLIVPGDIPAGVGKDCDCLLLVTGFHAKRGTTDYVEDYPGISPELASMLRAEFKSLKFVGMDFISVSRIKEREKGRETHRILLNPAGPGRPVMPVEDMDLAPLAGGARVLSVTIVPLRVTGVDGSPCTVIAELEP